MTFLPDGVDLFTALLLIGISFFTSALTAAFGIGGGVAMLGALAGTEVVMRGQPVVHHGPHAVDELPDLVGVHRAAEMVMVVVMQVREVDEAEVETATRLQRGLADLARAAVAQQRVQVRARLHVLELQRHAGQLAQRRVVVEEALRRCARQVDACRVEAGRA